MIKSKQILLGCVAVAACFSAQADQYVVGKASTLGLGAEYGYGLNDKVSIVGGFNSFSKSRSDNQNEVDYKGDLKLSSMSIGAHYRPFSGAFYLGAGFLLNNNEISLKAQAKDDEYEFNGNKYNAAEIGSAKAKVDFKSVAPVLGLGWQWELLSSGVVFQPELGVAFTGSPDVSFDIVCSDSLASSTCDEIKEDAEKERKDLQKDLDDLKIHPVISLGFGYRF